jgi:hypothetical protein
MKKRKFPWLLIVLLVAGILVFSRLRPSVTPVPAPQPDNGQGVVDPIKPDDPITPDNPINPLPVQELDEHGVYSSKEDVALFIHLYGHLPDNYISKKEAQQLGWDGGSLEPYAPGKCIGGTYFGNYEGILPKAPGREYAECDIDTLGAKSRGAKRIVFSNDGLIYYTEDHYETFELLYGEVDG